MATLGNKYVVLECPYGSMRPACSLQHICNGAKGERKPGGVVQFVGHEGPVIVPEHWLADDPERAFKLDPYLLAVDPARNARLDPGGPDSISEYAQAQINQLAATVAEYAHFVHRIGGALGTEERGDALIEIARNAHRAEQELAARLRACADDGDNPAIEFGDSPHTIGASGQ